MNRNRILQWVNLSPPNSASSSGWQRYTGLPVLWLLPHGTAGLWEDPVWAADLLSSAPCSTTAAPPPKPLPSSCSPGSCSVVAPGSCSVVAPARSSGLVWVFFRECPYVPAGKQTGIASAIALALSPPLVFHCFIWKEKSSELQLVCIMQEASLTQMWHQFVCLGVGVIGFIDSALVCISGWRPDFFFFSPPSSLPPQKTPGHIQYMVQI